MAETRKSRRVANALLAKQRYDETKAARARNAYGRREGLTEMGASGTAAHYEKGSEDYKRLTKQATAAKKRASQARKSTGPRKLNGE